MTDGVDDTLQLTEAGGLVPDMSLSPSPVPPISIEPHSLSSSVSPPDSPGPPTVTISASEKLCKKPHPQSLGMKKLSIPTSASLDCINEYEREKEEEYDSFRVDSDSPSHHVPRPSSALRALREAVGSVSNMEDFERIEKIGSGFFADVYKVRRKLTNQIMVLKVNKGLTATKTRQEVELLKRLNHPNILHYIGSCIHNEQLHPLTEFVNGGTLKSLIQDVEKNPFPREQRIQLSLDMALGMEYLHENGMLHRDFNSNNCLLRKEGDRYTAVVADFGLAAKNPNLMKDLRCNQSVVGTPFWMAPEVLHGKRYDKKADTYSYGIVLCEIVSRKDADPDEIPRNDNFSLNEAAFRELPEVIGSPCPPAFIDLACNCSKFVPDERPGFPIIVRQLIQLHLISVPPSPVKRISWQDRALKNETIIKLMKDTSTTTK
ncbi:PREDICTED: dual specificity testis-specific protein kinase 1-like [Amphimedon queenslandica]|uniref:Protein kinase domain-containing protein n=2 Tax=Amphimedon queenslandica TaxID=400682 RepID=A0AAN0IHV9_AMPQE|nr:PREDICTED: dual specificity testis-specific protein kinase 1-like [Amphimedon queenslandica]|eukprot:XP_003389929.2 PREDICTED: dual specificity testis-specific protein kinase 1-like [Amphimedon queenslandica]